MDTHFEIEEITRDDAAAERTALLRAALARWLRWELARQAEVQERGEAD